MYRLTAYVRTYIWQNHGDLAELILPGALLQSTWYLWWHPSLWTMQQLLKFITRSSRYVHHIQLFSRRANNNYHRFCRKWCEVLNRKVLIPVANCVSLTWRCSLVPSPLLCMLKWERRPPQGWTGKEASRWCYTSLLNLYWKILAILPTWL